MFEEARKAQQKREHTEAQIMTWEHVRGQLTSFLERYPLHIQQDLEQQRLREEGAIVKLSRELERTDYELDVNRET
ncbi:hypothetical protein, partial [Burkholderia sp. SIMBA_024]|uniref:hypothetical protein n=1 Tax=Burkholderia sp. SIMBA_024 TaxID=3085768 RepID=UPI00397C6DA6